MSTGLESASRTTVDETAPGSLAKMRPLELRDVTLAGEFGRRVERMIEANVLAIDIEKTFLPDFRERGASGNYVGFGKFIDSVVRFAVATGDERLMALKKKAITDLIATQEPDGYMGIIKEPQARIKVMWDLHECSYLIWGLVSDYRYFKEVGSLQAARRLADWHLARFAANPSLRPEYPSYDWTFEVSRLGFDEALIALSRATGDRKYRDFVVHFLKLPEYDAPIHRGTTSGAAHVPSYVGACAAQLELYRETADPRLLHATKRVLQFLLQGDGMLVTGSSGDWECWHDTQSGMLKTSETCASTFLARLMDTLLQLEGDSLYGDMLERNIYNALFAATAPDGTRSRYHTPFDGERYYDPYVHRMCCANNNKRFLADLRSWVYYRTAAGVAVNLYNASTATIEVAPGITLRIEQQTDYPTSGRVLIKVDPSRAAAFEVKLRIPRWCEQATASINGAPVTRVAGGQFHSISRKWQAGDAIELNMPMSWRFIRGRRSQTGRAAVMRGPVIFTYNPEHNAGMSARPGFEPRLLMINPLEMEQQPIDDASVRPNGVACEIKAWPPDTPNPWPITERYPVRLTEYPDPGGRAIYFVVPGEGQRVLVEDELLTRDDGCCQP